MKAWTSGEWFLAALTIFWVLSLLLLALLADPLAISLVLALGLIFVSVLVVPYARFEEGMRRYGLLAPAPRSWVLIGLVLLAYAGLFLLVDLAFVIAGWLR